MPSDIFDRIAQCIRAADIERVKGEVLDTARRQHEEAQAATTNAKYEPRVLLAAGEGLEGTRHFRLNDVVVKVLWTRGGVGIDILDIEERIDAP